MKLNRPTLALALLSAALTAPAQTALHPDIDAFRMGEKAYVIAPARPVAAFDYIEMVFASPGGSEWLLVEHRQRIAQDTSSHITEADFMRPTESSLYHPGRNMVRPLPTAIPPGRRYLGDSRDDIVMMTVTPKDTVRPEEQRLFAIHAPSGRFMEMQGENQVWIVDDARFLTEREGRLWLTNWNGERQAIRWDKTPTWVVPTGEPGKFAVSTRGPERTMDWHLLDVNTQEFLALDQKGVEKAYEGLRGAPQLLLLSEPGRPDTHSAWFGNEESTDLFDFENPRALWGTADGRLPHELDTRGHIAGDLAMLNFQVPAGYSRGLGNKLGAAWYVRDRMMFVRAVEEMSIADYTKYIAMLAQDRAMAMAQEAVLAFNGYRARNEERLPENAGWRDAMRIYMRNDELFGRVTYLGNGERMTEFREYQQVMGFIDTPYGRANFNYGNGVSWVPKVTP